MKFQPVFLSVPSTRGHYKPKHFFVPEWLFYFYFFHFSTTDTPLMDVCLFCSHVFGSKLGLFVRRHECYNGTISCHAALCASVPCLPFVPGPISGPTKL